MNVFASKAAISKTCFMSSVVLVAQCKFECSLYSFFILFPILSTVQEEHIPFFFS